jgi:ketosteroid isomerase-like protein
VTESNVDRVRELFEVVSSRPDPDELPLDRLHPEIEVISPITSVSGDSYRGHEGARRWTVEVREQFEAFRMEIEKTQESGDRVLVLGHIHLRGQSSGVEFDQRAGWLIEFQDELVWRVRAFTDRADAIAAFENAA